MTDVLIIGDTFRSPELRHEIPLGVPDPFVYLERDGARHVYVGSMEVPRIRGVAADIVGAPARGDRDRRAVRAGPRLARDPPRMGRPRRAPTPGLTQRRRAATRSRPATSTGCRRDGVELTVDQGVFDERRRVKARRRARRASGAPSAPPRPGSRPASRCCGRRERRRGALARRRAAHGGADQGGDAAASSPSTAAPPRTSSSRPGRRARRATRWATARSGSATRSSSISGRATTPPPASPT